MSKRVHEVAKELGISSKDLMKLLNRVGVEVKSHSASLDDDVVGRLKEAAKKQSAAKAKSKPPAAARKQAPPSRPPRGRAPGTRRHEPQPETAVAAPPAEPEAPPRPKAKQPLKLTEGATVKEFADAIRKPPTEIIKRLMALGEMVTINQPLSHEAVDVLAEELGLEVRRLKSGPLGGDLQLGALIAEGEVDLLVFFWDPLEPMPHDPDVKALLRIAVVWNVPVACNRATADYLVSSPLLDQPYERAMPDFTVYERRLER